jgi:hypothetical protein
MSDVTLENLTPRINQVHTLLLTITEELTEDELYRRFGPTAPPIGWHLWHISRFADRLQATLPRAQQSDLTQLDPRRGIWERERLAARWDLDPATLGRVETGIGMSYDDAEALPRTIGREALLDYARRVMGAVDEAVAALTPEQFAMTRPTASTRGGEGPVAGDLFLHLSHAGRHLGMIEALRGLLGRDGTATT